MFTTNYHDIIEQVEAIKVSTYARSRNFNDGAVSRLSPYISRGIISTRYILQSVLKKELKFYQVEKFVQELAWRDYWQQIWVAKGILIDEDLKRSQPGVKHYKMPVNMAEAKTGIEAVDEAIKTFFETGYLHNHMRMYIASMCCNVAKCHWKVPAQWMYYHLLDADWASNALSWQWVAGANSSKLYYANQENINKYWRSDQQASFLDVPYKELTTMPVPQQLSEIFVPQLETKLPAVLPLNIQSNLPTCIYNFYNLDPVWKKEATANRVLLLEPSHFKKYPVSGKTIDFVLKLSENITGIQVYVGEFKDLVQQHATKEIYYKEHPLNKHYEGTEESREWMFDVKGYYPSFFAFYKKCMQQLKQ